MLGRGGSDYSASAIGAILHAARVELVKRYVPILTADPRHVVGARPIDHLSYEEAEELAQFGARVLHPLTIEPARQAGVELWVRSQEHPDVLTTIAATDSEHHTRAVTLLRPLRLLRLRVPGGRQRPGSWPRSPTGSRRRGSTWSRSSPPPRSYRWSWNPRTSEGRCGRSLR